MKLKRKAYKNEIFLFEGEEGCEFEDLEFKHATCRAVTGDISEKGEPLGFYMKVVGFYDKNAPIRSWGITLKSFLRILNKKRDI